jgi:hypothetical protein
VTPELRDLRNMGASPVFPKGATVCIRVTCGCGKVYTCKAEFAGRRIKCRDCGQVIQIPREQIAEAVPAKPVPSVPQQPAPRQEPPTTLEGNEASPVLPKVEMSVSSQHDSQGSMGMCPGIAVVLMFLTLLAGALPFFGQMIHLTGKVANVSIGYGGQMLYENADGSTYSGLQPTLSPAYYMFIVPTLALTVGVVLWTNFSKGRWRRLAVWLTSVFGFAALIVVAMLPVIMIKLYPPSDFVVTGITSVRLASGGYLVSMDPKPMAWLMSVGSQFAQYLFLSCVAVALVIGWFKILRNMSRRRDNTRVGASVVGRSRPEGRTPLSR